MNVVPEGRAKQKSKFVPSIWYQPTIFVFSPNPTHQCYILVAMQNRWARLKIVIRNGTKGVTAPLKKALLDTCDSCHDHLGQDKTKDERVVKVPKHDMPTDETLIKSRLPV
jgi:hypothetical protein